MLMILMALIELGKAKVHKATRWLWLALSGGLVAAPTLSCEETPAESDATISEGVDAPPHEVPMPDAWQPDLPPDPAADLIPQPLYGDPADVKPQPDEGIPQPAYGVVMDVPQPGDVPAPEDVPVQPLYGPVFDDGPGDPGAPEDVQIQPMYGPVFDPGPAADAPAAPDEPIAQPLYGVQMDFGPAEDAAAADAPRETEDELPPFQPLYGVPSGSGS
ncbi:MAG: hypothetical protein FJ087_18205 [Deltaproteobacteria bacterium]|nr:hypothetical protein [Deltaproteobacteria bacterium]